MNYHIETKQAEELLKDPTIPWGKVLGYSMSTERWNDFKILLWKTLLNWFWTGEWKKTEFRIIKPSDPGYDPTPYRVTHVL